MNATETVKRHGNYRPVADRLLARVRIDGAGCWRFLGSKRDGYGLIGVASGKARNAHRVAYELFRGPIPDGMQLDHLCRVRDCVNPWHLEPVTQRENQLRGFGASGRNARKTHCKRGHEFTEDNTQINRNGARVCRACRKARDATRLCR